MYLIRDPLWLFGVAAMVGAFVFQALALYSGRLSVVQSILVTELVYSLVIGRLWLRREVVLAAWASAAVTSAGLAVSW
jgi:drug/metabolite transporter (DMT)-like permease